MATIEKQIYGPGGFGPKNLIEAGTEFEDCEFEGLVFLIADMNTYFEGCVHNRSFNVSFQATDQPLPGTVELRKIRFRRCAFRDVGFVGKPELIERAKRLAR
jgi:hypothetical protein